MTGQPHISVVCYARKSSLVAPVDATLQTLTRLEADGALDDLTIGGWPAEIRLGDTSPHSDVVALFEAFDAWADQRNVSIRPPFAVETRTSAITGQTRDVLITPVQCLAISVNGVLSEVFPHTTAPTGETYTVTDALTLLEEDAVEGSGAAQLPDTPPDQRRPAIRRT